MNIGGEPGRDDYGLPPVNAEIPDDARELERDVQAYHRELRAQRRRMLARRVYAPLTRDGMILPLLAGCLALTLLAGTLLTVFSASREPPPAPRPRISPSVAPPAISAPRPAGQWLPSASLTVNGQPESLQALAAGGVALVFALVPTGCQCVRSLRQLKAGALSAGAQTYLLGTDEKQLLALSRRVGLDAEHTVTDSKHVLTAYFHPGTLMALLVRSGGQVSGRIPAAGVSRDELRAELRSSLAGRPRPTTSPAALWAPTATAGPKLTPPSN